MSSPFPTGACTGDFGGPDSGGHHGSTEWYIKYGMDLAAPIDTDVFSAFDGHVTVFHPHNLSKDTSKVFGAQIFIRSRAAPTGRDFSDDKLGVFYTHVTDVPAAIRVGAFVSRGDRLGKLFHPGSTHLHMALVEVVGGAPGGRYQGVNIFSDIRGMAMASTPRTLSATFQQSHAPPTVSSI